MTSSPKNHGNVAANTKSVTSAAQIAIARGGFEARFHAGDGRGHWTGSSVQDHGDGDHAGDEYKKREYSTDCAIGNDEGEVVWGSQCSQGPFRAREAVKVNRKECQRDP